MAAHGNRVPVWSVVLPAAGLIVYLLLGKGTGAVAGAFIAAAVIGCVLSAVHHAELVGARVGEPFGTLILAVAVTVIEVGLIVSIMLTGEPNPVLVRDTVHAVVILVLHGLAGACIVVGALRHHEAEYRTSGAQAFLAVLIPMSVVVLVLPNFTTSAPGPFYTPLQLAFVSLVCLALYVCFVFMQTVRHREFFLPSAAAGETPPGERPSARTGLIAFAMLTAALVGVVLLAKAFAPFIQGAVAAIGAPVKLVGVLVATIVLLPEAATALRAAAANRLQTSINLALGSAVACIGLTIPTVSLVAWWIGQPLALGVDAGGAVLLGLSFLMAVITYGTGRTNLLSGFVHLILFATWMFLIFQP
jgi:Ca2+:H+ antiporter